MEYTPQTFMGAAEIRLRLGGLSRQRVYQITSKPTFPEPVADLIQGKVWLTNDVEEWMHRYRPDRDGTPSPGDAGTR
jgi:prophage regulatory protein